MTIIKKSKIISIIALVSVLFGTIQAYQVVIKKKLNNKKQEAKPEKKSYKKLIIFSSIAIIITAILLEIDKRERIRINLLLKEENRYNNYKKIIIISSAIIGAITLIDFHIKKNDNNQRNSFLTKAIFMPSTIACYCKEHFKKPFYTKKSTSILDYPKTAAAVINYKEPRNYYSIQYAIQKDDLSLLMRLIEDDEDIEQKNYLGRTPLFVACAMGKLDFIRVLANNGANPHAKIPTSNETPITIFDNHGSFYNQLPFIDIEAINSKYSHTKAKFNCDKDFFIYLITNSQTAQYDKQDLIILLLDEFKKLNLPIDSIKPFVSEILFNRRFFNEYKFNEIRDYAAKNSLIDIHNNSILTTAAKFSKDYNLVFKLLMKIYEQYSYPKNQIEKDTLKKEVEITLENAKKMNPKLYNQMRNIDLMWCDLEYKNLLSKTKPQNKECLEAEFVKNIIEFIGIDEIKNKYLF